MIYKVTGGYPKSEEFALKSQTRRAIVSVPSIIAEGFKRRTKADSIHFYNIAAASLEEARYQIILARDLKYISVDNGVKISEAFNEVAKILCGWIKSQT
jgi:four helix bundle protein